MNGELSNMLEHVITAKKYLFTEVCDPAIIYAKYIRATKYTFAKRSALPFGRRIRAHSAALWLKEMKKEGFKILSFLRRRRLLLII
jgi:hypothetical protein